MEVKSNITLKQLKRLKDRQQAAPTVDHAGRLA